MAKKPSHPLLRNFQIIFNDSTCLYLAIWKRFGAFNNDNIINILAEHSGVADILLF